MRNGGGRRGRKLGGGGRGCVKKDDWIENSSSHTVNQSVVVGCLLVYLLGWLVY